jgi:hypothetical protein
MVAKRKTLSSVAVPKGAASKVELAEDEELETQIVVAEVMKKPAANKPMEVDEEEDIDEDAEEEESEEEKLKKREEQITADRTKELKMMYMEDLKKLATVAGITGTKENMIKALLKYEAKARVATREQEAKIRAVVVEQKEELESQSISQLGKLCESKGIKGARSKPERVQCLLVKWQEEDGVDKALARKAQEERKMELMAMDDQYLRSLCDKAKLDPFVKEVLVERISKSEYEMGRYSRAVRKEETAAPDAKLDVVDALLVSEGARKREKELKNKLEEEVARKKKELRAMSVEDLKKAVEKKGLEAGKKEEMIEALYQVNLEEEKVAARKSELKKMGAKTLKDLLMNNGLETGSLNGMIETMLAHEAKLREELRTSEAKVGEIVLRKKEELESKSMAALKEICMTKGLPVGGTKEEKVERLLEEAQRDGEVDKVVSSMMRNARKDALMCMEKFDLSALCEKMNVDPFVKSVMVERILAYEEECTEPVTKKARKSN